MLNQNNLSENIQKFILKLNYKENNFLPVQTGSTDAGRELNMGFTCYALKILYTIDSNYLDDKDWMTKIYNSLEGYKKIIMIYLIIHMLILLIIGFISRVFINYGLKI